MENPPQSVTLPGEPGLRFKTGIDLEREAKSTTNSVVFLGFDVQAD